MAKVTQAAKVGAFALVTAIAGWAVYRTVSRGVSPSPGAPPMVPRMPEMDRMSVMFVDRD